MTKPLSPAAQAILDSFKEQVELTWLTKDPDRVGLAAALRAAADHVVPPALEEEFIDRNQALPLTKMVEIRRHLYAIAAELEGQ